MLKALVLGELCLDVIIYNPESIAVLGEPIWAENIVVRLGGSATYTAQALLALGLEVSLSGTVGEDITTDYWLARLGEEGINIERVHRQAGKTTPTCVGICEGGQKRFIACSPLYFDFETLECPLEGIDILYFGGYLLYPELWDGSMARLFKQAKERNILVAVDTQLLPISPRLFKNKALKSEVMKYIDVLFVNRKEAIALTTCNQPAEAAQKLAALGPQEVVVKLGGEGCLTWNQGDSISIKSFDVKARDSIGAGDYFGAAFVYGLLQKWDLQNASDFANTYAALCISREKGKRLPSATESQALMGQKRPESIRDIT